MPGETVKVAADRLYSIEHIWVKAEGDQATIGISDKFQLLLEIISNLTLQPVGATIERYDSFGLIEGLKLTTELVMPVSGTILSVNPLMAEVSETNVGPLNLDPYGEGWMITIRLTNAAELNDLLTPEAYVTRIAKGQAEA